MTEAVPSWVLYKKAVFKNFEKSTGKHLCWSLYAILKKDTSAQIFPINFALKAISLQIAF